MRKAMTNDKPLEVILPEDGIKTNKTNHNLFKITSPANSIKLNSKSNNGSFIRRTLTPSVTSSYEGHHTVRIKKGTDLSHLDCYKTNYSGSIAREIRYLFDSGQRLITFRDRRQMKTVNSNVTIYNNRHKKYNGVKVKCRYDYNNLLILFYLTPIAQFSLEELKYDQEEQQYDPP